MYLFGLDKIGVRQLRPGHIIIHEGKAQTVGPKDIQRCPFMGTSVFGDSYQAGHKPVYIVSMTLCDALRRPKVKTP